MSAYDVPETHMMAGAVGPDGRVGQWKKRYPAPTAKARKNPARWTFNKVIELGESFPASHIMLLAWVAIYFIIFQSPLFNWAVHLGGSHQTFKEYWDTLLSRHVRVLSQDHWDTWRHFFRNGGEAFLVSITILFLTFNPHIHKIKKPCHTAGQVVGRFFIALAWAIPFMIGFALLLHGLQHWLHASWLADSSAAHPNLAQKLWADSWVTKVSVVLAAFVARRPMYPVYAFVQQFFAEKRVIKGKKDRWYHPAPFRATVRELPRATAVHRQNKQNNSVGYLMSGGLLVIICLAIYGGYILNHFA